MLGLLVVSMPWALVNSGWNLVKWLSPGASCGSMRVPMVDAAGAREGQQPECVASSGVVPRCFHCTARVGSSQVLEGLERLLNRS